MKSPIAILTVGALLVSGCASVFGPSGREQASIKIPPEAFGMYVGESRSGNKRICYYNRMGNEIAIAVKRTWDCPSSVHYDVRSIMQGHIR